MSKNTFIIDRHYIYDVDEVLEGGMGRVLLLTQRSKPRRSPLEEVIFDTIKIQEDFNILYRENLAAKTIKDDSLMRDFERECIIWLSLDYPGITPLLKVILVENRIYALMPRYLGNLRSLIQQPTINRTELIKLLFEPILGLSKAHSQKGLVHQDIKPENFLWSRRNNELIIRLSDWGIANVQSNALSRLSLSSQRFTFQTMIGFGTLPYMAPERLMKSESSMIADIFSIGIVFFEIATGSLPYLASELIENQLINENYFYNARKVLSGFGNKITRAILSMIHPDTEKRMQSYLDLMKFIKSL